MGPHGTGDGQAWVPPAGAAHRLPIAGPWNAK